MIGLGHTEHNEGPVGSDPARDTEPAQDRQPERRRDRRALRHEPPRGLKASFGAEKLAQNFNAIYSVLVKSRPVTVKGTYVQNISISSTMGPGIKVAPETANA